MRKGQIASVEASGAGPSLLARIASPGAVLVVTGRSGPAPGAPASGAGGDVPLAPLPTGIDPAGSGPVTGR